MDDEQKNAHEQPKEDSVPEKQQDEEEQERQYWQRKREIAHELGVHV